ncbi:hypothetical protein BCV70DRAFT_197338 [Testicularia cyperi]|uniref:Exocyst complex component Sec3 PIP2-binding N-terminal domain-containing protein n=1 Tax=Testicularia cyperi TaxID=1882483 RepID=A0A317XXS5_9BASI|nr:hypothetical protein BCV70DRAFT_197338 [Testicularia cyperi]
MSAQPSSSQLSANGANGGPQTVAAQNKTKDLFNAALQARNPNNNYIAHIKIWEDVPPESNGDPAAGASTKKARYLILAVQKDNGRVTINKAKRNANGTFSIGKDWDLNTLREVHVIQPDIFSITLSRPYQWQTQQPREQQLFLQSLVKVYRKYTQDDGPKLIGIDVPLSGASQAAAPVPESALLSRPSSASNRSDVSTGSVPVPTAAPALSTNVVTVQPYSVSPTPSLNISTSPRKATESSSTSPVRASPARDLPLASRERATSNSPNGVASGAISRGIRDGHSPSPLRNTVALPTPSKSAETASTARPSRTQATTSDSLSVPSATPRPVPHRKQSSTDNISIRSGSSGGGGGDARARLSSIEPMRGGAAYERMLLAGTGLSGVNEVDDGDEEEEDPYGGAVLADGEAPTDSSFSSRRATLGRPVIARIDPTDRGRNKDSSKNSAPVDPEEDENSTLVAVEEMLEGFEWRNAGGRIFGGAASGKGTADVIEARLLDELSALDSANIHAIIESDDRVALVVQHMEEALSHLDMMDSMIAGFKVQLNARADDISHIESQNRGLQVQTSNQRTLMAEIENLINTINVDDGAIHALSAGRLESADGIAQLESAAASLYKSMLQARRDGDGGGADMTAAAERLAEHESISNRFCKRVMDYLNVTFNVEGQRLLSDPARQQALQPPHPTLLDHSPMEDVLGQYCGLLLYMKEVSAANFSRVSASYFASASECYKSEIQKIFAVYRSQLKKASEEDASESSFAPPPSSATASAIRSGTIRRVGRDKSLRGGRNRGDVSGQESLQRILSSVFPILLREQGFISDFLHINDNNITFADYMDLEPYFRRRAAGTFAGSAAGPLREMKGALDLIFGFLAPELQSFTDDALAKDRMSIVGLLATLDRGIIEAEEVNCESLQKILSKLHLRLASQLERLVQEQIKGIEQTKLTVKKRKGVVHFIRAFPVFVERVESQLINAETLNIRGAVDGYYAQICRAMFDALQTISRADGGGGGTAASGGGDEDKGQLNHLVILIENMWHFISEVSKISRQRGNSALSGLVKRAETIYGDSLNAYTHFVLRRPLAKMMDFGDGIDGLLRSTPATEVSLHSAYSKSSFKKLVRDFTAKDTRKAIEALSKRVGKHFADDEESALPASGSGSGTSSQSTDAQDAEITDVLVRVWNNCQDACINEFTRLARIAQDCYPDQNVKLELGPPELKRLFAALQPKHR